MITRKPKILLWDVETSHNILASFQLLNKDMIPYNNILQERFIICACYKFLGQKKIYSVSTVDTDSNKITNDKNIVKSLHKVLSESDAIIGHNSDRFDLKVFNTRAVYYGLSPIPELIQIDTLKIAKQKFRFNSNRLDYIGQFLGVGCKVITEPGLWLKVLKGDRKAVKSMVKYCKGDIDLLEKIYMALSPYVPAKINLNHFHRYDCCPLCASLKIAKNGVAPKGGGIFQRFYCRECGHTWRSTKSEKNSRIYTR